MAENKEKTEVKTEGKNPPSSYPSETIDFCINLVRKVVESSGGGVIVPRDKISVILGKAENTLVLKLSTCCQFGLLVNNHGKGFSSTSLFDKIDRPEFEQDKLIGLLEAFRSAPLYAKLIDRYNGRPLPNSQGLANTLFTEFGVNQNSSEKASKIFFEICQSLKLIEGGKLKFLIPTKEQTPPGEEGEPDENSEDKPDKNKGKPNNGNGKIFSQLIPLISGVATLQYPSDIQKEDFELLELYLETIVKGIRLKLGIKREEGKGKKK